MTGKQLADVILTTANNDFEAPAYTVLYDTANLNPPEGKHGTVNLVRIAATQEQADALKQKGTASIEGHELSLNVSALSNDDFAFIRNLVQRHISQDQAAWMGGDPFVLDDLEAKSLRISVLSKEEVFGRGILDVGKAVHGPALLDANRMTSNNVVRVPALNNRAFAIETFDTAGYVAEFSNDIAQRSWIDRYHHPEYHSSANGAYSSHARALVGKDVGLRKTGQGTLILSGNNTYAGATLQKSHEDVSAWESSGMGLVLGAKRYFLDGLSVGAHLTITDRSIDISGEHSAQADTQSIFVGLHCLWAPAAWDGFWLTAQGRLGLENGDMDRTVAFNGYIRSPESHWTGIAGGALIGGGKDWSWEIGTNQGNGNIEAGPLAWVEYSFLQRPDIEERLGQAASLSVSDELYQSLVLCLGAHVGWNGILRSGESLNIDLLAAWQHAALNTSLDTDVAFKGYDSYGFSTETALPRKDSMVLQSSVRLTHPSSFFIQAELAGEFFRSDYTAINLGVGLGFAF